MADENGTDDSGAAPYGRPVSALDEALAMGSHGPMDPRAGAYLEEQTRLARQQAENLREQNAFELSHLRWRRFNDQMKGALQIMAVALGALLVAGIGAAVWNASQAEGLVVDSFTAPPDYVARGMGGDALAADLTHRIQAIRTLAINNSIASSSEVSEGRDDVKVDIPETGVSLGEVWRMLRAWLGHEQHVSGSLREIQDGTLVLNAAFSDGAVVSETGKPTDLDAMETRAAEEIFAHVDPTNIVIYFWTEGRAKEAMAGAANLVSIPARNTAERASEYALWANFTRDAIGDVPLAEARVKVGLALDPKITVAHHELANAEFALGHNEGTLHSEYLALAQNKADQPKILQGGRAFDSTRKNALARVAKILGDFGEAERIACGASCIPDSPAVGAYLDARRHDVRGAYGLLAVARATVSDDPVYAQDATYYAAFDENDWQKAIAAARKRPEALATLVRTGTALGYLDLLNRTGTTPLLAIALAKSGDLAGAQAAIDATPLDCYTCVQARGVIAVEKKDRASAERWFAEAVRQGPSIPFAYLDWARLLAAKGDLNGAIAKLELATDKGPHFADTRELWGELLILTRRSDLASQRFASAAKDAPNWGRLHLKWGEALLWSGDAAGAKKQFAIAGGLFLTAGERSELARVATH